MRAEVLEDMGVGENGVKVQVVSKYSLTHPKIKLQKRHLWIGKSCWGGSIKLGIATKPKPQTCKNHSSKRFS